METNNKEIKRRSTFSLLFPDFITFLKFSHEPAL